MVRRPHRRLAAGVVLTGALAAATVGGTVGFAHLRVRGWSVHAVGGLLALVGGLVVVGVLAVELIRSVHGWARLAALPIALALVAFVVYPVLTAVYATAQPHARLGSATPATLGRTYTDVRFRTADGITLSGWYCRHGTGPRSRCCTARRRLAARCSTRPSPSTATGTECCCSTPAGTVAAPAARWTSAGTATATSRPRSTS